MTGERVVRRLAAILAADVVGYSRLMERDESGALLRLKQQRAAQFEPALARNNGRLVKLTGDGALAEFGSAVEAVRAAVEFQQGIADADRDRPEPDRMMHRVGIHLGDLIVNGADVYGDAVNVAARLEAQAPAGGIVLSRAVCDAVIGRLDIALHDLGELALKNLERPVQAYRVDWTAAAWAAPHAFAPAAAGASLVPPAKPSIAVLAFNNLSGDAGQEYFSDGITEDIITSLSRHHGIFVIARNSSFAYKGQAVDVGRVGHELGVRYVLEGSVQRAGDRVRITAQLIEAQHRTHVWAERYDRQLLDVFAVQDEITRSIVATVAPELLEAEMQRVRRQDPRSLGAWECALRAQWHLAQLTRHDIAEAIALAAQATALDPGTTLGFDIAAFAHIYEVSYGWTDSPARSIGEAYAAAAKAVALDSRDAVSQSALAVCEVFLGRPDDAIARLRVAIDLNPNFTWAHGNLGLALAFAGRPDEALACFEEALRLSPRDQFNFLWLYLLGFALFLTCRYDDALRCVEQALRENPTVAGALRLRAACLGRLGRIEEARAALAAYLTVAPAATIALTKAQIPLKRPEDLERYVDSLRKAGLPEG